MSRTALIFCGDVHGHRQSYAAVTARILSSNGYDVAVAHPELSDPSTTRLLDRAEQAGYLRRQPYKGNNGDLARVCRDLEDSLVADLTVFPAGDELCPKLIGLSGLSQRKVRRVAYFIIFTHLYGPKTIQGPPLFRWRRWASSAFRTERFLRRTVPNEIGVERMVSTHPKCFSIPRSRAWVRVPEIYRAWGFEQPPSSESQTRIAQIQDFTQRNPNCEVLLYYGHFQARRGYDALLRLAEGNDRYAVLFLGRWDSEESVAHLSDIRSRLNNQGRLLELLCPYDGESEEVEVAFNSCRTVPLPYENHYNLSGIMIQSCSYGKPVVVPAVGWMASETRNSGLGWIYDPNTPGAFECAVATACESADAEYSSRCQVFADRHNWEMVNRAYAEALLK